VTDRVFCLLESFASNYSETIDGGQLLTGVNHRCAQQR
jgi:hypothetical protein